MEMGLQGENPTCPRVCASQEGTNWTDAGESVPEWVCFSRTGAEHAMILHAHAQPVRPCLAISGVARQELGI